MFRFLGAVSWRGFPTYLAKCNVEWATFLVAQNHFATQQKREKETLNLQQSLVVALQTTACVTIAKNPFDVVNTARQTGQSLYLKNRSFYELFWLFYRSSPLGFGTLLFYNFGTTIFLDRLKHHSLGGE